MTQRKNPEGILSFSPGLRSYPGLTTQNQSNPNGVLAGVIGTGTQPRWGCDPLDSGTQGSSSLATLGWRLESLWDSPGLDSCCARQRKRRRDKRANATEVRSGNREGRRHILSRLRRFVIQFCQHKRVLAKDRAELANCRRYGKPSSKFPFP